MSSAFLSSLRGSCWILMLVLLFAGRSAMAADEVHVIDDFTGLNINLPDPDVVSVSVDDSDLAISVDCTSGEVGIVHIPLQRSVTDRKVRLYFSQVQGLPYTGKFETTPSGEVITDSLENYNFEHQKGPLNYSLHDKYYEELSLWFKCRRGFKHDTGTAQIEKIEIVPLAFTDDRGFVYILALIILVLFVAPGLLLYCALFEGGRKQELLTWLAPLSMLCLFILYLVLVAGQLSSVAPGFRILSLAYGLFCLTLAAWLAVTNRLGRFVTELASIKWQLLALCMVMLGVAAVVTENLELPLYTLSHEHMRYLTYGAFGAHDPMFQYVNGIAILHDEPFSKYYEGAKLLYGVQDRGVLGGVLYAVVRGIAAPFNQDVAYSYGFYTLFGSVLNASVLLPVFALHGYFSPARQRPFLILYLMCASAFLVTNFYLTWFKLAGAGLVISGIVLLLSNPRGTRYWIAAGALWGLAANFHPGLALSFPVVTIWLLYRSWRDQGNRILPVVLAFAGLISAFIVMITPWELVKSTYYEDTNSLFRQHFLASEPYDDEHGIAGSIAGFMERHPLSEQLPTRIDRLQSSFRIEEVASLFDLASAGKWREALLQWNLIEKAFTIHVFTMLVALLAISGLLTRLMPAARWSQTQIRHASDFRWLLITQILCILLIIVGSYGKFDPDLTWQMPTSALVILLYLLVHAHIAVGKIGLILIAAYSLFTYYRLFFQYF